MDSEGSMADKHQAVVFESYSNKPQIQSLAGVLMKSTWLRACLPPPHPHTHPPFLSAPPDDREKNFKYAFLLFSFLFYFANKFFGIQSLRDRCDLKFSIAAFSHNSL